MARTTSDSQLSRSYVGQAIPGATDRQQRLVGFDQAAYSESSVVCIGAGGLISQIAPTLVRKGIGALTILDNDVVEASNLNRQRFYSKDLGRNKAYALAENLVTECVHATVLTAYPLLLEEAIDNGIDLSCDVAICGVDNNPARVEASRYFRGLKIPVIFTAVSADADHGYVLIQEASGPCFGCLFPDAVDSRTYACPATPAIADILQAVGSLAVYAIDTCLMGRPRKWNYRKIYLSDGEWDAAAVIEMRGDCSLMTRS
ncbi:MAG: ThiF family adenylyltransferase [Blastocatellia bacterium]